MATIAHVGRYALKYLIGAGSRSTVYAAHDPVGQCMVAVKTLGVQVPEQARATFESLFLGEAAAAAALSHPGLVPLRNAGLSELGPYVVMDLLVGRDLRQLRQDHWRPTPAQAALIVGRIADALGHAHDKGVVHGGIEPANIFMVGRTEPRILDIGIARVMQRLDLLADHRAGAGSPYYRAPEQWRGGAVDRRTDIFALGVVLYELLAGVKPFLGMTQAEISASVSSHRPATAHDVNPEVPLALAAVAERAMQKNPDDRYRSARALARDLRHALATIEPDEEPGQAAPARPRTRWPRAASMAAGVALAAVPLWWFAHVPPSTNAPDLPAVWPSAEAVVPALPAVEAVSAVSPAPAPDLPAEPGAGQASPAPTPTAVAPAVAPPLKTGSDKAGDRRKRLAKAAAASAAPAHTAAPEAAPVTTGVILLAVSPWGQIDVDGQPAGIAPPLTRLVLPEGPHTITVRNEDFPAHAVTVTVSGSQSVTVKHRF